MLSRSNGVLLPIFSLPSRFGIGDLGPAAFRFADFLCAAGQRIWQVLPLNPTEGAFGHSPYHSVSCFAFNPLLISPEGLAAEGLVERRDLQQRRRLPRGRVDYAAVVAFKRRLLDKACRRFRQRMPDTGYEALLRRERLLDRRLCPVQRLSARHTAITWKRWPLDGPLPKFCRKSGACGESFMSRIENLKIEQYLFYCQWLNLRSYCRKKCIHLFGDLPIYVPFHSADVWAHRQLFKLDRHHRPLAVSGVPPDYFSADGQLWGHPVYNWESHRRTRFDWWFRRIAHQMAVFDACESIIFADWWRIGRLRPGRAPLKRAVGGGAVRRAFFRTAAPFRPAAAGCRRPGVHHCRCARNHATLWASRDAGAHVRFFRRLGLRPQRRPQHPGALRGLHRHPRQQHGERVVRKRGVAQRKTPPIAYFRPPGWGPGGRRELIRIAMLSLARWSIIPAQDLLGLGAAARINTPGQARGNWDWRMTAKQFDALPMKRLLELTTTFGRA